MKEYLNGKVEEVKSTEAQLDKKVEKCIKGIDEKTAMVINAVMALDKFKERIGRFSSEVASNINLIIRVAEFVEKLDKRYFF